jgi:hypothetical protein
MHLKGSFTLIYAKYKNLIQIKNERGGGKRQKYM